MSVDSQCGLHFIADFNAEFGRAPAQPTSAFVPLGRVDLEQILCVEHERVVGRDNVVTADHIALQLDKQPGRRTCAACMCWSGATSMATIPSGTAPAALAATTAAVRRSGPANLCRSPSGHFTVSNSCGQITYQQHEHFCCS